MKKLFAIFLLITFLISNSGIALTVHYCGGKIASIDFIPDNKHKCKCGNKAMKPGCCKEKTALFKVNNEMAKTSHFTLKLATPKNILTQFNQFEIVSTESFYYCVADYYHPPPFKPKVPIYLLNRVIII